MENQKNKTFVLRTLNQMTDRRRRYIEVIVFFMFLFFSYIWFGGLLFPSYGGATSGDMRITLAVWGLLFLFAYLLVFVMLFTFGRRLEVDSHGVAERVDMPNGFGFKFFVREWRFCWSDVSSVAWVPIKNGMTMGFSAPLIFTLNGGESRSIAPYQWVIKNSKQERDQSQDIMFNLKLAFNSEKSKSIMNESLEGSEFVSAVKLARPDLDLSLNNVLTKDQAKVENTISEIVIAATLIFSVMYFWLEVFFTLNEFYAESTPYVAFIVVGVAASALCRGVLGWAQPNAKSNRIYCMFFGLAISFASYPLSLRINQLGGNVENYTYVLSNQLSWQAVGDGDALGQSDSLPTLDIYLSSSDWWRKFKPGDQYDFQLRKGILGFWQINMKKIYEAQKLANTNQTQ